MSTKRVILELGSGNDLHGSDYTKAALRAVQDALHHSSLTFVRTLQVDKTKLDVEVTIGVQRPERVDLDKVKQSLPIGNVTVKAVKGGLDVADADNKDAAVIASAEGNVNPTHAASIPGGPARRSPIAIPVCDDAGPGMNWHSATRSANTASLSHCRRSTSSARK